MEGVVAFRKDGNWCAMILYTDNLHALPTKSDAAKDSSFPYAQREPRDEGNRSLCR